MLNNIPAGKHTIRIMKVTGYTLSRAELTGIIFAGGMLTDAVDTSDKDLYIEFVGDSITCAWGTIGEHGGFYRIFTFITKKEKLKCQEEKF